MVVGRENDWGRPTQINTPGKRLAITMGRDTLELPQLRPQFQASTYTPPVSIGGKITNRKMPTKPRSHANPVSRARTLKARVDSKRYGSSWRRIRDAFLAESPVCHCNAFSYWDGALGVYGANSALECTRIAPATIVDHIRPMSMGGTHDWDNLQSLCYSCHTIKTRRWG